MIRMKDNAKSGVDVSKLRLAKKAYMRQAGVGVTQYLIRLYFDRLNGYDLLEYEGTKEGEDLRDNDLRKILYAEN